MTIGALPRSVDDNFAVAVNFGTSGVFDTTPATSATATATAPDGGTVPTVTVPTVAANVATFRLSGGDAGKTYHVAIEATNGTDRLCRSIDVPTEAC